MSNNNDPTKTPSGVFSAKNWIQVVAIIVGYAFVQITISMTPQTAPYSMGSLAILGLLAFVIIRSQKQIRINRFAEYLQNNLELLQV